jgi:hypothetical protein
VRVLADSEIQFEVIADADELGPDSDCEGPEPEDGWWTVTVRATWWSPRKRPHVGEASIGCCALTREYTAEEVAREHGLRASAREQLNESVRELIVEAHAIREFLERDVFEVRAGGATEGLFPTREDAERYATTLRKEVGAQAVEVVPTSASKIRDLLDPTPEPLR